MAEKYNQEVQENLRRRIESVDKNASDLNASIGMISEEIKRAEVTAQEKLLQRSIQMQNEKQREAFRREQERIEKNKLLEIKRNKEIMELEELDRKDKAR